MKEKIKTCGYYKCNKSFLAGIRKKYCCDECANKALDATRKYRRINIKLDEELGLC